MALAAAHGLSNRGVCRAEVTITKQAVAWLHMHGRPTKTIIWPLDVAACCSSLPRWTRKIADARYFGSNAARQLVAINENERAGQCAKLKPTIQNCAVYVGQQMHSMRHDAARIK